METKSIGLLSVAYISEDGQHCAPNCSRPLGCFMIGFPKDSYGYIRSAECIEAEQQLRQELGLYMLRQEFDVVTHVTASLIEENVVRAQTEEAERDDERSFNGE